jgi:hypothetical protein
LLLDIARFCLSLSLFLFFHSLSLSLSLSILTAIDKQKDRCILLFANEIIPSEDKDF